MMITREICFGRLETRVIVIRATTIAGLPFKWGREEAFESSFGSDWIEAVWRHWS